MKNANDSSTMQNGITRRGFLAGAGVAALGLGALSITGCSSPKSSSSASSSASGSSSEKLTPTETRKADVVVVGAGASGVTCATRCAEGGLNTVLVEKSGNLGGASNSVFSAMVRKPEEVGAEVNKWVTDCHWRVNGEIIGNMLGHSYETFTYLQDTWGWEFKDIISMGTANWRIMTAGADRPGMYQKMLDQSGVDTHMNTTGKQLVCDSDGAISGIIVDENGTIVQYDTPNVVIATGGYAGNPDMVKEAFGRTPVCGGLPQNVGEGLKMCWAVGGAKPRNYGMQMPHQTYTDATDDLASAFDDFHAKLPFLSCYMPCFLNVGVNGRRFRNEEYAANADPSANSSLYQGDYHYTIVSASQLETLGQGGVAALGVTSKPAIPPKAAPTYDLDTPWDNAAEVFDKMVEQGHGGKGSTAEELAKAINMDGATLAETIDSYNALCAAGADTTFGKDASLMIPLGDGPYYAVYTYENNLTSCGGVDTDIKYRVLDENGKPISGLYAIGVECMSNMYNDTYTGVGAALCNSYVSGYLAAKSIQE